SHAPSRAAGGCIVVGRAGISLLTSIHRGLSRPQCVCRIDAGSGLRCATNHAVHLWRLPIVRGAKVNETHARSATPRVSPEEPERPADAPWHDRVVGVLRSGKSVALVLPAPEFTAEVLLNPAPPSLAADWGPCVFWHNAQH